MRRRSEYLQNFIFEKKSDIEYFKNQIFFHFLGWAGLAGPILAGPKFLAVSINGPAISPAKNGPASPAQIWAFPQH